MQVTYRNRVNEVKENKLSNEIDTLRAVGFSKKPPARRVGYSLVKEEIEKRGVGDGEWWEGGGGERQ